MPRFHPLIPLRIPSGWEVAFNNFVELGDVPDAHDRAAYLTQDLLSVRSTAPEDTPAAGWELDVGWYPDGDAGGAYRLVLVDADGEPAVRLESRHAEIVRDAVALCLNRLNEGAPADQIQQLLDGATRDLS